MDFYKAEAYCEVTALHASGALNAARNMGAHEFVATGEVGALESVAGKFNLIINTTNANLDWEAFVNALAPRGVLHTVGAVTGTFGVSNGFNLIGAQKSLSASPLGSPVTTRRMIDFCARHAIAAVTEALPLLKINDAFEKLRSGSPRYRIVIEVGS